MRLFRNLPIGRKLALSAAASLALLGVLAWSMLRTLDSGAERGARSAAITATGNSIRAAWIAARGIAVAAADIQVRQTPDSVADAAGAADRQARRVQDALADIAAPAGSPEAAAVQQVEEALAAYRAGVQRAAELRVVALEERDAGIVLLQPRFDSAVSAVRRGLAAEDLPPSEADEIQEHLRLFQNAIGAMREAVNRFLATGDSGLQERVTAAETAAESHLPFLMQARVSPDMLELTEDMATAARKLHDSSTRLFQRAAAFTDHFATNSDRSFAALEAALQAGAREFIDLAEAVGQDDAAARAVARRDLLALAAGIACVMAASGVLTARAIARPIGAMTRAVQAMAGGDTASPIGFGGRRDEVGHMAEALEVLRAAVARAFVQSQMVEQIPIGVMTADAADGFRISYLNAEARAIMAALGPALRLPPEGLIGQSMDCFHADPAAQRALLSDPARLPHRSRIRLGAETLELNVSALRGSDGGYLGPMVTWHTVTRQVLMSDRFESSVAGIAAVVATAAAGMRGNAEIMAAAAVDSSRLLGVVAEASREASGHVQSVAAHAEDLSASVGDISRQVAESAGIAAAAVVEARATDASVSGLSEAATRIGDVVRLIGDIAARTNLLALNATIEAARAGEAGRGFAVVAGEVKNLATQTARATAEIGSQIVAMQGAAGQAAQALRSIGATIGRMNDIAAVVAGAVEQQGTATRQIAHAAEQAALGTGSVDANLQDLARAVADTGSQADGVLADAANLTEQSGALSGEVATFLRALQAA